MTLSFRSHRVNYFKRFSAFCGVYSLVNIFCIVNHFISNFWYWFEKIRRFQTREWLNFYWFFISCIWEWFWTWKRFFIFYRDLFLNRFSWWNSRFWWNNSKRCDLRELFKIIIRKFLYFFYYCCFFSSGRSNLPIWPDSGNYQMLKAISCLYSQLLSNASYEDSLLIA